MTRRRGPAQPALLIMADGSVQPDLFGETEAELTRRVAAERARLEFESRARHMPDGSPVLWTAPYDVPAVRRGQSLPGWRCWLCGGVEVNEYVLGLNHGLHSTDPLCPAWTACIRQSPEPSPLGGSVLPRPTSDQETSS